MLVLWTSNTGIKGHNYFPNYYHIFSFAIVYTYPKGYITSHVWRYAKPKFK